MLVIIMAGSFLLLSNAKAAVKIDNSLNLGSLPGYWKYQANGAQSCPGQSKYDFCSSDRMFLEIAQKSGPGANVNTTLDVKEIWTKSYIDPNRLNNAVIGIYDGIYSRNVFGASNEYDANGSRETFSDQQDVVFEFYVSQDIAKIVDGVAQFDEAPCTSGRSRTPFYKVNSSTMPKNGWAKINVRQRLNESTAACKTATATQKTGKIVIFTRAYWRRTDNPEGRVNAFKVGTAYTDQSNDLANTALTGFFSDYANATNDRDSIPNPDQAEVGQYAVQNRIDSENTQGRYYFGFAPDCRLTAGAKEKRYIKWKDVDYPNYYPGVAAPRFRLLDVTNASNVRVVKDVDGNDMDLSGSQLGGPNKYQERQVEFTGGRIYEWHWYNITARDGIAFWMPYDDFPALVGGCGTYDQKIGLWQGRNGSGYTQGALKVTGGDKVSFLIDEQYVSGNAAASQTTTVQNLTSKNNVVTNVLSPFADALKDPVAHINISDNGIWNGRASATWSLPGMGPTRPYTSRRWILFQYDVKTDAKNGSSYCVKANMNPKSSSGPAGGVNSNQVCFTVDNSLKPYITTSGGDVHAGNCTVSGAVPPLGNGKITAPPPLGQGSSGSYIVSANDAITKFGSGGELTDTSGPLTFGKSGKYGPMCRPTLSNLEEDIDMAAIKTVASSSAVPYNLANLTGPGVIQFAGGGSGWITGISRYPVTVYAPNGTVTIVGGSFGGRTDLPTTRANLPVVGVIAKNIAISKDVVGITAVLYAVENIDTCYEVPNVRSGANAATCKNILLLNGFAMARDFSLKRTRAGSFGLQPSEVLAFNAAFYLNPPQGFSVAAGALKYLGERAPLY